MATTHTRNGRRRRPEDLCADFNQRCSIACKVLTKIKSIALVRRADDHPCKAPERRHPREAALIGFRAPELALFARHDCAQDRVLWLIGLKHSHPRLLGPPSAPRNLTHLLKGALGGTHVRALKGQIRINNPHKREQREVMAFGHKLRTDDDISSPFSNRHDLRFEGTRRSEEIRAKDRNTRLREALCRLLREPLDPRANDSKCIFGLTRRADLGDRPRRAALMAHQLLQEAVFNHPRITIRAGNLLTTFAAERHRRIAAAVEKQERLLPLEHPRFDSALKLRRYPAI